MVRGREMPPLDRERSYDRNTYESLRNSGFNDRAEVYRNDTSKYWLDGNLIRVLPRSRFRLQALDVVGD